MESEPTTKTFKNVASEVNYSEWKKDYSEAAKAEQELTPEPDFPGDDRQNI